MEVKKTVEFFGCTVDELLELDEQGGTNEENILFGHGENVTYFDNVEEYEEENEEFEKWMVEHDYEIKDVFKTVNERLAIVLISNLK